MRIIFFAAAVAAAITLTVALDKAESRMSALNVGNAEIRVEIADEPEERFRGLSGRPSLGQDQGMLFIFDAPGRYSFVMRGMNFDLDFIWIDENGKIVHINENVSRSYSGEITPPIPVRYILEVNAGWSDTHGVKIGEIVKNSFGR